MNYRSRAAALGARKRATPPKNVAIVPAIAGQWRTEKTSGCFIDSLSPGHIGRGCPRNRFIQMLGILAVGIISTLPVPR